MARKSNNISILQFDAQAISCLRVARSARGLDLLAYASEQGPWNIEDGALDRALAAFAAKHGIKSDLVFSVLPRHDITTRFLTLPTQNPEEAANMVRLSAEEFVPYTIDEMIIDQSILEKLPTGEARVLAALAHRDVVEGHLGTLQRAGIETKGLFLSTACLAALLDACHAATFLPQTPLFALVTLGFGGIEAVVVDQGVIRFSRGVAMAHDWRKAAPTDENTPSEPAAEVLDTRFESLFDPDGPAGAGPSTGGVIDELASEIRGSLAAYRRESDDGIPVESIFLAADMTDVSPWGEMLTNESGLAIRPAEFCRRLITRGADHAAFLPLSLLGAALMAQERSAIRINLLPASMLRAHRLEGVRRTFAQGAAMVAVILVALGFLYYQAAYQRQRFLNELERKTALIEPKARGVASKRQQLQILSRQVARSGSALELLATACASAPDTVNITTFSYRRAEGMNIWGRAKTVDDVHAFAEALRRMAKGHLSLFSQARSIYEQEGVEQNQKVFDYQIAIPFAEEEKSDESPANSK